MRVVLRSIAVLALACIARGDALDDLVRAHMQWQRVPGLSIAVVKNGKIVAARKHLSEAPESWSAITIRHLLTHTSGLVRDLPGFDPFKVQPDAEVIASTFALPLRFEPGAKREYSNTGYYVLAEVIRRVSGENAAGSGNACQRVAARDDPRCFS